MNLSVVASQRKEIKRLSDINAELLEAIQNMVTAYEHEASIDNLALLYARAVISKALGQ